MAESARASRTAAYPEPLVIPSLEQHKQTFIILHGRGSSASIFGPPLLETHISDSETFRSSFPNAQFVFPTASKRRAQIYHRSVINQWFDNWHLQQPDDRVELQIPGLRETSAYIHSLLQTAIDHVGAENVVVGGLSQGCAAALLSLLTWNGEPIAAAFGMCGWLPFRLQLEEVASSDGPGGEVPDDDDPFAASEEAEIQDAPTQAIDFLCEELEIERKGPSMMFQRIPVFLGHGVEDEKVSLKLGREAARCIKLLGANVEWREYERLGHWYSAPMLLDLVRTLGKCLG
ncbi:MAG: hypothetical protein Q9228_007208 [Teloschistes exilis]